MLENFGCRATILPAW